MHTFKINYADILIGLIGIGLGIFFNDYFRKIEDQKLLAELKAELEAIKGTSTSTSSTGKFILNAPVSQRQAELEYAIAVLERRTI